LIPPPQRYGQFRADLIVVLLYYRMRASRWHITCPGMCRTNLAKCHQSLTTRFFKNFKMVLDVYVGAEIMQKWIKKHQGPSRADGKPKNKNLSLPRKVSNCPKIFQNSLIIINFSTFSYSTLSNPKYENVNSSQSW
jgi:hypothetical protein